jgi:hypothetical protein
MGGFENMFDRWPRARLLADAAFRLNAEGWAVQGGPISRSSLDRWFESQLPPWLRFVRRLRQWPFSEHGLNISLRAHLKHLRK